MNKYIIEKTKTIFRIIRDTFDVISYDWDIFWTKLFNKNDISNSYNFVIDMDEFDQEGKNKMMNILKEHGINVTPNENEEVTKVILNFE